MINKNICIIHSLTLIISLVWLSACASTSSNSPAASVPAVTVTVAQTSAISKPQPELEFDP